MRSVYHQAPRSGQFLPFCNYWVGDCVVNVSCVWPTVETRFLSKNDDTGERLDQPAEALLRNDKLYISNFDVPQAGTINTKYDAPHTISVLE